MMDIEMNHAIRADFLLMAHLRAATTMSRDPFNEEFSRVSLG